MPRFESFSVVSAIIVRFEAHAVAMEERKVNDRFQIQTHDVDGHLNRRFDYEERDFYILEFPSLKCAKKCYSVSRLGKRSTV
jgi:hypothetical protein